MRSNKIEAKSDCIKVIHKNPVQQNTFHLFAENTLELQTQDKHPKEIKHQNNIKQCRICIQIGQELIMPCKCIGTTGYVHFQCLKMWIQKKSQDKDRVLRRLKRVKCQMCQHQFKYKSQSKLKCQTQLFIDQYVQSSTQTIIQILFIALFFFAFIFCMAATIINFINQEGFYGMNSQAGKIVLIIMVPVSLIISGALGYSFVIENFVKQIRQIISIQNYDRYANDIVQQINDSS